MAPFFNRIWTNLCMGMGMVQAFYHGDVRVPAQGLPLVIVRHSEVILDLRQEWALSGGLWLAWIPDRLNSESLTMKIFSGSQ